MPILIIDNRKAGKMTTSKDTENDCSKKKYMTIAFCVACNNMIIAMNHTAPTFFTYTPQFVCKGFEDEDPCHVPLTNTTKVQTCPTSYEFYAPHEEQNMITEWDLVCDRKLYAALSVTWYFVAVGIGSMITGTLNDKYGRKTVLYVCIYTQAIISLLASSIASSYFVYVALRFAQGLFMQGIMTSMTLIINESLPIKYRTFGSGLVCLFWPIGLVILSILAYFIPNWRHLNLAICCISMTVSTLVIGIVPESHIWLESQQAKKKTTSSNQQGWPANSIIKPVVNYDDTSNQKSSNNNASVAGKIKEVISRVEGGSNVAIKTHVPKIGNNFDNNSDASSGVNGTSVHKTEEQQLNSVMEEKNGDSVLSLLKILICTKQLRNRLFMMMLLWFTEAISYFGVTFSITEQAGNHYANFLTGAILEEICYLAILFALYRFRRKFLACLVYATGAFCYISVIVLSNSGYNWADTVRTFLLNLSKSCITSVFVVLILYAVEIFPTKLRGMSLGICFVGHRIATLSSPVLLLLADVWSQLPYLVLAVLNVVSLSVAYICLPEKRDKLPRTVRETIEPNLTKNDVV